MYFSLTFWHIWLHSIKPPLPRFCYEKMILSGSLFSILLTFQITRFLTAWPSTPLPTHFPLFESSTHFFPQDILFFHIQMSANDLFSEKRFDQPCTEDTECRTTLICRSNKCTCPSTHYRQSLAGTDKCEQSKWLVKSDQIFKVT